MLLNILCPLDIPVYRVCKISEFKNKKYILSGKNVYRTFKNSVNKPRNPLLSETEKNEMDANVLDWEPGLALFVPDEDPLRFYNRIACLGSDLLLPGGKLYFEINQAYGRETAHILEMNQYRDVRVIKDIFGKDRIVTANR